MESIISDFNELSPGIKVITEDLELLGAPLTTSSTKKLLHKTQLKLSTLLERLHDLKHHVAFYILRISCCFHFELELHNMDNIVLHLKCWNMPVLATVFIYLFWVS